MPDTTTDAGGAIPPLPWSGTRQFSPICQIKSKLIHLTAVSTRIAELASSPPPSSTMSTRTQAWLADVLARIAALTHTRVHELLPWNWKATRDQTLAA